MRINKISTLALFLMAMASIVCAQSASVTLDNREWMADNLSVTTFNNGDIIPQAETATAWIEAGKQGQPAWCDYENDPKTGESYGKLYNWHAVNDSRGLAPQGWHVASAEEWQSLIDHYGGDNAAGGPLKEQGVEHWQSPNTGATNSDGFCALPSGYRDGKGDFTRLGYYAVFWTSSPCGRLNALARHLSRGDTKVYHNCLGKEMGFSVRCVRDADKTDSKIDKEELK